MPLGTGVGLGSGHTVLDWDPALRVPKKGTPPIFGRLRLLWRKVLVDHDATLTEIGLSPGNIVLDGDRAPLTRDTEPPISIPCLFSLNGWTDQDNT